MNLESTPEPEATDAIRTLHVDDDRAFAELTAEFLELNDPRISIVSEPSASAGLDRLGTDDIDCVVSDYDMPGRNGIEFLEAVRAEYPDLPFILFTGKGSEEIASEAVSAGVTDYLQKERGTDQYTVLANRIVNVTEKHRTEADLERRTRQHEAVATLGRKALEADDLSALFDEAARLVADRLGSDYAAVLERRDADDALALVAGAGWTDGSVGMATIGTGHDSPAGRALATGEPVVVADLGSETGGRAPDLLVDHGVESGIAVVVGADDEPWGVLGTYTTAHRRFTEHDVTFVRNVANVLGAAIDRLRTEERLRESEARFREIAELTPDGLFRTDLDGTFRYVSPAAEDLLGRPAEELVGMGFDRLLAEQSYLDAIEGFSRVVNGGVVRELSLTVFDADGEPFEVEVSASPVRRDGEVVMVQGIARDVTERTRHERELQQSRERYRALVENFPNGGVFLFDDDLRFTAVGGTELDAVGLSADDVIGKTPAELFPDGADVLEPKYRAVLDGEPQSFEDEWEGRQYQVRAVPIRDADGTVVSGMAVAQNVTERRAHERKLDQLRKRTQSLAYTETPAETIELAIDAAAEVIGAPLSGFHAPNDAGDVLEPVIVSDAVREAFGDPPRYPGDPEPGTRAAIIWEAFERGEPVSIDDTDAYDPLTEESPVGSVILNPVGDHGVFVVSAAEPNAYDETDRSLVEILTDSLAAALDRVEREQRLRERERRLERQNERLEEFTSIVSHDLRNPLNVAQGRLALVYDECDSDHLDAISTAHGRMEALIDDLLTLAREGETGDPESVDLATVVEVSWQHVETAGARLVTDTDRTVRADEGRLTQLLENLVRNSVEHGPTSPRSQAHGDSAEHSSASNRTQSGDSVEHGSTGSRPEADGAVEHGSTSPRSHAPDDAVDGGADVTVRVGDLPGGFFVEDDGTGIPVDERDRVFEPGYSTAEGGTGFGLNIVATIAAEHGWSLAVTESADGGARFEITGVDTG